MSKTLFPSLLKEKGIELSEEQLKKFQAYYETLAEWNEKMNLTAITEEDGVYLKHFYDSLSASFYYDFSAPISVVDVGAGAGFPSIPLKIVYPHIKVTIVDSLKKTDYVFRTFAGKIGVGRRFFLPRPGGNVREKSGVSRAI